MKTTGLAVIFLFLTSFVFAAFPVHKIKDNPANLQAAMASPYLSFETMHARDFEGLTGKKLSPVQKLGFALLKHRIRKNADKPDDDGLAIVGGFALGFFFSWLGVLIAYLVSKSKKFRRAALYGFATTVVLAIFFLVLLLAFVPFYY